MAKLNGHCLCGDVAFNLDVPTHLEACHCGQCRRWSGSVNMSCDFTEVSFEVDKGLKWYRSSEWAERGFCKNCGSSLFYRLVEDQSKMSVCAGALNNVADDILISREFFIDEKPGFYNFEGERQKLTGAEVFAMYGAEQKE